MTELEKCVELVRQLIYSGARVQVWVDQKFATVLTVELADGMLGITTMHTHDHTHKNYIIAADTPFSVILPLPLEKTHTQEKETVREDTTGD